jgi:hypothetical protein
MSHQKYAIVIEALNKCAAECNHCFAACLDEENVQMLTNCIKLDIDCAQLCTLTASLLARGSEHGLHLLKECAELCDACAAECEKHSSHHEHCKNCAVACSDCADICQAAE